jgi:hypothetical protein
VAQLARERLALAHVARGDDGGVGLTGREERVGAPDGDEAEQQEDGDRGGVAATGGQSVHESVLT